MSGDLIEAVRDEGLLAAGRRVVVLVSGGRDSTCLLDLAARIGDPDAVCALHVNYGLRQDAEGDEAHCRTLCGRLGVRFEVRRPGAHGRGNVQAWAREERYAAATALAAGLGGDVAVGHTATDQVETILYRLASSPSRRALLGMRPREGPLLRPLLRYTREQTGAHCVARGLEWREDESNSSGVFARGRIRGGLVPALREIHPAAEDNVLAVAEILRAEGEVLDRLVDEALGGRQEIELAGLRELPGALRRLVVQRLADAAADGPAAGAARRADDVAELGDDAALDLPHGVRAIVERGVLRFGRTPPKQAPHRISP